MRASHAPRRSLTIPLTTAALITAALFLYSILPSHAQDDDPLERGAYLATIAGCQFCHSPQDGPAFSSGAAQGYGREVYAPNLTPAGSGLGSWSDAEIRAAITTGLRPDGRQLDPVMPYLFYNAMADSDLDALIAFLRGLEPIETPPSPPPDLSGIAFPTLPERQTHISLPDPADPVAYGGYLVGAVLACGSCHTPLRDDGLPDSTRPLAGGQAFSGEWGTVYAGNLTPDRTSGLLPAMQDEVVLAIVAGRHPDGRPIYAMPWQAYSALSGADAQAVIAYLYSLPPITSDIPLAALNPGYEQYPPGERPQPSIGNILTATLLVLMMGGLMIFAIVRQYRQAQRLRDTDWVGEFTQALAESRKDRPDAEKEPESDQSDSSQP